MNEGDFKWILTSSFIVSTPLLFFSDYLWGWAIINIAALAYHFSISKKYNLLFSWLPLTIFLFIALKSMFIISVESLAFLILSSAGGVLKWGR